MFYLILSILSSVAISLLMRVSEKYSKNNMGMFMANYAVCALMSVLYMEETQIFVKAEGIQLAVILGILSGIMYLVNFVLMQLNMRHNGVALTSTFMKLGVLVPTLMAIVVFHEMPTAFQILGFILAVGAIILIHFDQSTGKAEKKAGNLLLIILLFSGMTDSMANIYEMTGASALKDHYLLYTFFAALILAFILALRKKQKITVWDIVFGILIGIPNYFSARFLLLALGAIPAVVAYPVCSVAIIILISLAGMLLFKEKISKRKMGALGIILLALVLLNL